MHIRMSDLELLKAVRRQIGDPEHWTKQASARDVTGSSLDPEHVDLRLGCCWCIGGAAQVVTSPPGRWDPENWAASRIARLLGFPDDRGGEAYSMVKWQDHKDRTHAEVLAKIDEAIFVHGGGQ